MVRVLRASGVDLETIARALCIDPKTLGKYFKVELTFGHEDIKARMGLALVRGYAIERSWIHAKRHRP